MGRVLALAVLALAFAGALFGAHAYLVQRLVLDAGLGPPWRGLATAAIALLGSTLVLQPVSERLLDPARTRGLAWVAGLWMGFAFVLVVVAAAADVLSFAAGAPALAAGAAGAALPEPAPWRSALLVGAALAVGGFSLRQGLRPPSLVRAEFEVVGWPRELDGFRIVQLSDVHIGPILDRRFAARLVERVNALEPDLVAITGDLVDGSPRHLASEIAPFADLRARHGVYFVTGNHDHLSGARSWVEAVRRLGIRVLRNERVRIERDGAGFDLAGVDDHHGHWIGGGREDLAAALADRDERVPLVLLAHDPSTFRAARRAGVDLQLSGHTHGGQVWPFHYVVRLAIPWVAGRYRDGAGDGRRVPQLYVSRGTGFWGPPMRLLAPAEITQVTLRPAAGDAQRVPSAL